MADNIAITAGSGTAVATDEVGGAHYQYVKTAFGVDGTATLTSTTNPLPVSLTNLEKAEDAAHTTADKGVMALGVVSTTNAGTSVTDQDYAALTLNIAGALRVTNVPNTTGGLSMFKSIDIDETEEDAKASAGMLYSITAFNASAGVRYLKLYDNVAASVIVGTTAPTLTFGLKAGETTHFEWANGLACGTGICFAATTGVADNDAGAPGANDVVIAVGYK